MVSVPSGKEKIIVTDKITEEQVGIRTDIYLAELCELPRAQMQKLLADGCVTRDNKTAKANYKLRLGDSFQVVLPSKEVDPLEPENIPLDILYEDEDILVVNKARGMVVHPAAGVISGTLVNALLYHCGTALSTINGDVRPGIVHRLDKDTSGVMVVAKNDMAHVALSHEIASKEATREYLAVVRGNVKADEGRIETYLIRSTRDRQRYVVTEDEGRLAITDYQVVERYGKYTVVKCQLLTGRTHQIRVHMEYLGNPVVGDPKYSPMKVPFGIKGQALHSVQLVLTHPRTKERMEFQAPVPEDMQKILTRLENGQFT